MKWISNLVAAALLSFASLGVQAETVVEYIHTDALGSPVAVTDVNQNVVERSEYEPYGRLLNRPVSDGPGYTGHVSDAATGLAYMQQRYYDPMIGVFLSVDPVVVSSAVGEDFNRYRYAKNNPYKFVDPDGRAAIITRVKDERIDVDFPVKFKGAGATEANMRALKEDVAALSGTYNVDGKAIQVNFKITEVTKETPRRARNIVTLTDGPTSRKDGLSHATLGGKKAEIDINDRYVRNGAGPHEMLHLAGVDDKYDRKTRTKNPEWGSNIMNVVPGVLEDRNMPEMMGSKSNVYRSEGD